MKEIKEDDFKKILFGLGILLILTIPLMIMDAIGGGFLEAYLSALVVLFLAPFIVPMSILTWEFDFFPFSMWYVILFWTLPPIMIGVATKGEGKGEGIKGYDMGYLLMLMITIVALFLGILSAIAYGLY